MATKHQFVEIFIGEGYTARQKKRIADELIDLMADEAMAGKGLYKRRRKRFPDYSKGNPKKGQAVDLHISGDMLNAIELLDTTENSLIIGFEDGTEQNAKADGNIRGTYGRKRARPKKARPFLGVTATELDEVLESYEKRKRRRR